MEGMGGRYAERAWGEHCHCSLYKMYNNNIMRLKSQIRDKNCQSFTYYYYITTEPLRKDIYIRWK